MWLSGSVKIQSRAEEDSAEQNTAAVQQTNAAKTGIVQQVLHLRALNQNPPLISIAGTASQFIARSQVVSIAGQAKNWQPAAALNWGFPEVWTTNLPIKSAALNPAGMTAASHTLGRPLAQS